MEFKELKKELPYKWRVQSTKFGKTTCVAYIDARDCQDLLDEVVGAGIGKVNIIQKTINFFVK